VSTATRTRSRAISADAWATSTRTGVGLADGDTSRLFSAMTSAIANAAAVGSWKGKDMLTEFQRRIIHEILLEAPETKSLPLLCGCVIVACLCEACEGEPHGVVFSPAEGCSLGDTENPEHERVIQESLVVAEHLGLVDIDALPEQWKALGKGKMGENWKLEPIEDVFEDEEEDANGDIC